MNRIIDGVLALVVALMTIRIGSAAFGALVTGLQVGALSTVVAAGLGLLIAWMLFKWLCALLVNLGTPVPGDDT